MRSSAIQNLRLRDVVLSDFKQYLASSTAVDARWPLRHAAFPDFITDYRLWLQIITKRLAFPPMKCIRRYV